MIGKESLIVKDKEFFFPSKKVGSGNLIKIKTQHSLGISASPDYHIRVLNGDKVVFTPLKRVRAGDYVVIHKNIRVDSEDEVVRWVADRVNQRIRFLRKGEARVGSGGFEVKTMQMVLLCYGVCGHLSGSIDRSWSNQFRLRYLSVISRDLMRMSDFPYLDLDVREDMRINAVHKKKARSKNHYPPMNKEIRLLLTDVFLSNRLQRANRLLYEEIRDFLKDKNLTRLDRFVSLFNENIKKNEHTKRLNKIMEGFNNYIYVKVMEVDCEKGDYYEYPEAPAHVNCFEVYDGGNKEVRIEDL